MKRLAIKRQGDIKYPIRWTTLGEYLDYMQRKGVTPNVASFVGATTVRVHELGEKDVDPTPAQLTRMRALVRQAMKEGAIGVGSSLIYAPATYAETPELTALVDRSGEMRRHVHQPHALRGEQAPRSDRRADRDQQASRARRPKSITSSRPAKPNWGKIDAAIAKVERRARERPADHRRHVHLHRRRDRPRRGDADLGAVGRARSVDQAAEGPGDPRPAGQGNAHAVERLGKSAAACRQARTGCCWSRSRTRSSSRSPARRWPKSRKMRGKSPEETAMDLVIEDGSRVGTIYFLMSEDNVKREVGAAVDELRVRRSVRSARRRVPRNRAATRAPTAISSRVLGRICPRRTCGDACPTRSAG